MVFSFYGVKVTLISLSCSCLNMFYNIKSVVFTLLDSKYSMWYLKYCVIVINKFL